MLIRNITNKSTPKVIGVGHVWLQPGEEKYVTDDGLYVDELDMYKKPTGKKVVISAIMNQVRLNMIEIVEDKKEVKSKGKAEVKAEPVVEKEEPVIEQKTEAEAPKKTRTTRKKTT